MCQHTPHEAAADHIMFQLFSWRSTGNLKCNLQLHLTLSTGTQILGFRVEIDYTDKSRSESATFASRKEVLSLSV